MTAAPSRPNLGALFTGSTPPDRAGAIAPAVEHGTARRAVSPWGSPTAPVESYFDLLHAIVDANRQFAVLWTDPFRLSARGAGPRR